MKKKIKDLRFYYDNFAQEIVFKKNDFAAPERYFEMGMTNVKDMYQDTWVDGDKRVNLSYTKSEIENVGWDALLALKLKEISYEFYSFANLELRRYPKQTFLKILSDYFNVDFENEEIEVEA